MDRPPSALTRGDTRLMRDAASRSGLRGEGKRRSLKSLDNLFVSNEDLCKFVFKLDKFDTWAFTGPKE